MPGACATASGCSRPTGCAPRVTRSMRSFAAGMRRLRAPGVRWSKRVDCPSSSGLHARVETPKVDDSLRRRSRTSAKSCFQSSGASARRVKASAPSSGEILPRRATRQRAPAARSCAINASPSPEASAKTSHDFSAGVSTRVGDAAGSGHALRASKPIWPSPPAGPISPGSDAFREACFLQH